MLFTKQKKHILANSKQQNTNLNEIITAIIIIFIGFVIPSASARASDCHYCHWHYVIIIIPRIVLYVRECAILLCLATWLHGVSRTTI